MATTEVVTSKFDTLKLILAAAILGAGIYGYYYFAEQSQLYRTLAMFGVLVVVTTVVYQTALGKRVWGYLLDARAELRKVVWPTRSETIQTTLIVAVVVVIVGLGIWGIDWVFGALMQWLLGLGG
jgi:preprotein translocase subunit SecE